MRRLAWFSPVPPVRTGIAGRSAELLAALRQRGHTIDVYGEKDQPASRPPARSAHDFVWIHQQHPYDLIVYQFGNSSHHDYEWPYALRYPGLVVLHDTRLHHARAATLLRQRRAADYRREFAWNHPDVRPGAAELAIAGFDSRLYYDWPMARALVETSRLVAVHGEGTRAELIDKLPTPNSQFPTPNSQPLEERIVAIRLGEGETLTPEREAAARRRVRTARGIPEDAVVFGVFGGLTPEKRIPQILAAFRVALDQVPSARLLFAGGTVPHYDLAADVSAHGLTDRAIVTGYLPSDADVTDHLAACDVSLNLRWPTARETSGPWLRALAAGRATVITDLVHMADVPSLDPRTWTIPNSQLPTPHLRQGSGGQANSQGAVCVAIDVLDEDHSLRLAMRRLATDAALRAELGRAAAAWWRQEHSVEVMVDDYENAIQKAIERPPTPHEGLAAAGLPEHMRDAGDALLRTLAEPFDVDAALSRDGLVR